MPGSPRVAAVATLTSLCSLFYACAPGRPAAHTEAAGGPRPSTPSTQPGAEQGRPEQPREARRGRRSRPVDPDQARFVRENYTKREVYIPVRDGVRLFTAIYEPRDASERYPIMMVRTPYSIGPYGENDYPGSLGPSFLFTREGCIFVYQDVRGRFMSEGEFVNMTPHVPKAGRGKSPAAIDESTDTYDTIEWLIANVPNHNGRVGQWGISYPGFYASAGMIDAHPALRAVSPQAPIADWFFDDFYHHGAFFLPHWFNFFAGFGRPRPGPTSQWSGGIEHGTPDGYQFFLDLGPLKNVEEKHFKGNIAFWTEITRHPAYDEFWQKRNLLPHLRNVAPAVMTVGGWFDAEDLYGACQTYRSIESQNPGIFNMFVMGPWRHGGWARGDGERLGNIHFGSKTSEFYRENIELKFFNHFLKGPAGTSAESTRSSASSGAGSNGNLAAGVDLPEAYMFETGANRWRTFHQWPPAGVTEQTLYLGPFGSLSFRAPSGSGDAPFDEFVSDPAKPAPFTEAISIGMTSEYMTDDQRFAARRPDVLTYRTEPLEEPVTLAGPIMADLWVSTSGTDSDWVVKLIDVFPPDAPDYEGMNSNQRLGNYHMMVRSEAVRGRYRNSYEHPEPFEPDRPTYVDLPLQDVLHTFGKGHRIMVQIQCTWFPLMDRNPQKYVPNIFEAEESDFIKATQRVYRGGERQTGLRVGVLN